MDYTKRILLIIFLITALISCSGEDKSQPVKANDTEFSSDSLTLADTGVEKFKGQVLYMPIYSNIPCKDKAFFDLSAFIAIHNTDMNHSIKVTKVFYFDNNGKLVKNFLDKEQILSPLSATTFFVPKNDKSGTGANFIVEWISDLPVTEPLIESVMVSCDTNYGISFLSKGKVIRTLK